MAEGFARHFGEGLITAASAGLAPTDEIVPETIGAMDERGVDIRSQFPKKFVPAVAESFDYVVNLTDFELPPLVHARILARSVPDPFGESMETYRTVRDRIEEIVRGLIDEIDRFGVISSGPRIAPPVPGRLRLWQRFTKSR
jgi:arsenate reductase